MLVAKVIPELADPIRLPQIGKVKPKTLSPSKIFPELGEIITIITLRLRRDSYFHFKHSL
jgi:hypothetical protein